MNLYIRFFDSEILATSVNEALDFLASIPDVDLDEFLADDIRNYAESDVVYPKRYKVHGRAYFIIIKTTAQNLDEFKAIGASAQNPVARRNEDKARVQDMLTAVNVGWYDTSLLFRRVLPIPNTQKFQYLDTEFCARVKASSIQDSYVKVVDHLRTRTDIDPRSQFPSVKGKNFKSVFLGMNPEV